MKGNHTPTYKVGRLAIAANQVHDLVKHAAAIGFGQELNKSLKAIVTLLKSAPLTWGEPQYHTHLAGGVVRHGVLEGLSVQFVVYENQRAVVILNIAPIGDHPLAGQ